jgi:hypothetical protein
VCALRPRTGANANDGNVQTAVVRTHARAWPDPAQIQSTDERIWFCFGHISW